MGKNSKIKWTDHTFNPWIGCQKVSPGCDHCYAEAQNAFRKWNDGTWGRVSEHQILIGKSPSNGIGKPEHLNVTTGIDPECFVHRLPTCLIIRSPRPGAQTCLN